MWIILPIFLAAFFVWLLALNIDDKKFGGRFLIRAETSPKEFKESLVAVLAQSHQPIETWPAGTSDWVNDKMYIPIRMTLIDKMRESIVKAIEANLMNSTLKPETVQLIQSSLDELEKAVDVSSLISALRRDAQLHRSGTFEKMGGEYELFDSLLPSVHPLRAIPLLFWDSWLDEKNHGFPGFYKGIRKEDWPELATTIANSLEYQQPILEPCLLENFGPRPMS